MSLIEFDSDNLGIENKIMYSKFKTSSQKPRIIDYIIKKGIVKTENQANILLLVLIIVTILFSVFLYRYFSYQNPPISPEELIKLKTI